MPDEIPRAPRSTEDFQERLQERLRETAARVEADLRSLASYINDEVVPDVRRFSSTALRDAAIELHKLAQRLDDERGSGTPPPPPTPPVPPRS